MKKHLVITFGLALSCLGVFSQGIGYDQTALNFSRNDFGGTARSMSMAGAFGALGADISTLSSNPAGLGVYRSGEYSFTTSVTAAGTGATFQNNKNTSDRTHFNINEFGIVGVMKTGSSSGIMSVNFGFGMNRVADFNRNYNISANNTSFSQVDAYVNDANGTPYTDLISNGTDDYSQFSNTGNWQSVNAWESGLMGREVLATGSFSNNTYKGILAPDELVNQSTFISERGTLDEYDFSVGINVNDKLYFGSSLGVQDLYYSNSNHHAEDFQNGGGYDDWRNLTVSGTGVNFKFGVIYTPTQSFRLGLAVHTPTYFNLNENYYAEMSSYGLQSSEQLIGGNYYYVDNNNVVDPEHRIFSDSYPNASSRYDYMLNTPMKGILSAAYVFGSKGLISFDYEYSDYSNMNLSDNNRGDSFKSDNNRINNLYNSSNTFRLGGEYRASPNWLFRAGYAFYGSPYNKDYAQANGSGYENNTQYVTTGIGYRYQRLFIDFAYVVGLRNISDYSLYNVSDATVDYRLNQQRFALTVGFRL